MTGLMVEVVVGHQSYNSFPTNSRDWPLFWWLRPSVYWIDSNILTIFILNWKGGICREKCLNGGKCIQKDLCSCRKGYYGPRYYPLKQN